MPRLPLPFSDGQNPPLLFHSCHHKCGTHWLRRILTGVARRYGLNFIPFSEESSTPASGIVFDQQSRIDTVLLPAYRGSHMIRDPRDVVVSGYFYHLWTKEDWVHRPQNRYNGLSYQQYLNSLSIEDGLIAEILVSAFVFKQMRKWDYSDANTLELKYESCFDDPVNSFAPLFRHYGFVDEAVEISLKIASDSTFESIARRKPGVIQNRQVTRSGQPGQWRQHFTQRVKDEFRNQAGDLLQVLAYEINDDW
jgi:hypothetical protein